jgi:hypothetical protein
MRQSPLRNEMASKARDFVTRGGQSKGPFPGLLTDAPPNHPLTQRIGANHRVQLHTTSS